jgi:hypothetical protein
MIYVKIALLAVALAGAGCARSNTSMLDNRTALISGRGSAFNSSGGVMQAMVREAAQQAQARGYQYFVIEGAQDRTRTGAIYTPSQSTTNATVLANCAGPSCMGTYRGTTTTSPGLVTPISKPGADMVVRFYREGEPTPGRAWNVAEVLAATD